MLANCCGASSDAVRVLKPCIVLRAQQAHACPQLAAKGTLPASGLYHASARCSRAMFSPVSAGEMHGTDMAKLEATS